MIADRAATMLQKPFLDSYSEIMSRRHPEALPELLEKKEKQISQNDYLALPGIIIPLTSHCPLKCKHCVDLIPYKAKEHFPLESVLHYTDRLLDAVDEICVVAYSGGESFMYPHLYDVLERYVDNQKIHRIQIITNGLIQPELRLLQLLKSRKIFINITVYGVKLQQVLKFIETLMQENIDFELFEYGKWHDMRDYQKLGLTDEQMKNAYESCAMARRCKNLISTKGIITPCATAATLISSGKLKTDELEILRFADYTVEQLKSAIREHWLQDAPTACDYCSFASKSPKLVERGEQIDETQSAYTIVKQEYLSSRIGMLKSAWKATQSYRKTIEVQKAQIDSLISSKN